MNKCELHTGLLTNDVFHLPVKPAEQMRLCFAVNPPFSPGKYCVFSKWGKDQLICRVTAVYESNAANPLFEFKYYSYSPKNKKFSLVSKRCGGRILTKKTWDSLDEIAQEDGCQRIPTDQFNKIFDSFSQVIGRLRLAADPTAHPNIDENLEEAMPGDPLIQSNDDPSMPNGIFRIKIKPDWSRILSAFLTIDQDGAFNVSVIRPNESGFTGFPHWKSTQLSDALERLMFQPHAAADGPIDLEGESINWALLLPRRLRRPPCLPLPIDSMESFSGESDS